MNRFSARFTLNACLLGYHLGVWVNEHTTTTRILVQQITVLDARTHEFGLQMRSQYDGAFSSVPRRLQEQVENTQRLQVIRHGLMIHTVQFLRHSLVIVL